MPIRSPGMHLSESSRKLEAEWLARLSRANTIFLSDISDRYAASELLLLSSDDHYGRWHVQYEHGLSVNWLFGQLESRWIKTLDIDDHTLSNKYMFATVPGLYPQLTIGACLAAIAACDIASDGGARCDSVVAKSRPLPVSCSAISHGSRQFTKTQTGARGATVQT